MELRKERKRGLELELELEVKGAMAMAWERRGGRSGDHILKTLKCRARAVGRGRYISSDFAPATLPAADFRIRR